MLSISTCKSGGGGDKCECQAFARVLHTLNWAHNPQFPQPVSIIHSLVLASTLAGEKLAYHGSIHNMIITLSKKN
jgi:hypothetical protein